LKNNTNIFKPKDPHLRHKKMYKMIEHKHQFMVEKLQKKLDALDPSQGHLQRILSKAKVRVYKGFVDVGVPSFVGVLSVTNQRGSMLAYIDSHVTFYGRDSHVKMTENGMFFVLDHKIFNAIRKKCNNNHNEENLFKTVDLARETFKNFALEHLKVEGLHFTIASRQDRNIAVMQHCCSVRQKQEILNWKKYRFNLNKC